MLNYFLYEIVKMWKFSGDISSICEQCGDTNLIPVKEFYVECTHSEERNMGAENIYEISYEYECSACKNNILLKFEASEYPVDTLSFVTNLSEGASTDSEPDIEHYLSIYDAPDLENLKETISDLILKLKESPKLLYDLKPREFEEVIAEIFKSNGYEVELTKQTRDGGKDIIAIETSSLGIKNKYFIECKRYKESNKIDVNIIRSLFSLKNTRDAPNKVILVTTSSFTPDAKKFVSDEALSEWHIDLIDYNMIVTWLKNYKN